jgi:dipeptidyl aminopeptidase/acylaminoacyl peptidase
VLDALCGVAFFAGEGISRVVIVGHSFGGAVAVCAGTSSPRVRGVVALASQSAGSVQMAPYLAPRSLLIIHGTRDKVLPATNARKIYDAAAQPKELRLLNDVGHGLTAAREEILELLLRWIPGHLSRPRV